MSYHRSSVQSNGYSPDGPDGGVGEEAPTYLIEHLATFTVDQKSGIVYPSDGMRRLRQLEESNGIWSQKMKLRLDVSWVLIMDYETGAVMERFPVALIRESTAFTSLDLMEIYYNILVFIVGEEQSQRSGSRSEMHIFQCQSISAQDLVEDLQLLRAGKVPARRPARRIPPPPARPLPEPPGNGVSVREQMSVFNAASHQPLHPELGAGTGGAFLAHNHDYEVISTSTEKNERDVTILNHCFADIEKFIARLQHAAAAKKELERRRRNRKSKKKDLGDGMLTMRAKLPPELEFIDIFQKIKLSFNLLARMKAHIDDSNAPELVHFLFTPLALIVDATLDTHYGPNLSSKVVLSPLLTREAVNLLNDCVTRKERVLWHLLGDAWRIPRDQWKGYVAPYHPVFLDGWSPENPVADDRDHMSSAIGAGVNTTTTAAVATEGTRPRGEDDSSRDAAEVARPTESPPMLPPKPPDWVRRKLLGKKAQSSQDLHEELKNVLTFFREKRRNLDIVKTPEVYISQKSDPDEVKNWLEVKGFSDKICKQLRGVTGDELFSLTKSQLVEYCGKDEGHRLDSQLTVQRIVSGYNTTQSQEIRTALARARENAEAFTPWN